MSSSSSESEGEPQEELRVAQFATESDFEEAAEEEELDEESDVEPDKDAVLEDVPFSALVKAQSKVKERTLKRKRKEESRTDGQGGSRLASEGRAANRKETQEIQSRSNKHAPQEMSSKRAVKRARTVVETPKIAIRDPRFDSLSGSLNEDKFEQSYAFLKDNKKAELANLRATVKKAKKSASISNKDKETLQRQLTQLESSVATDKQKAQETEAMRAWKKAEREKQDGGKRAFYLKDKQRKEIVETDRTAKMDKRQLKKRDQRRTSRQTATEYKEQPPARLSAIGH